MNQSNEYDDNLNDEIYDNIDIQDQEDDNYTNKIEITNKIVNSQNYMEKQKDMNNNKFENEDNKQREPFNDKDDFLESSIVADVIKNIENLEIQYKEILNNFKSSNSDICIEIRIKQLAFAKLLVNIYEKDIFYLIKAYSDLGSTYLENEYFEQAAEHLLNAFKLNENVGEQNKNLKDFQIQILINLAKCYIACNKPSTCLDICHKGLKMNQTINGENDITNADIYYVMAKAEASIKNYKNAITYFSQMFNMFENHYGYDSDKCAKVCMELGQIYEISGNISEAIDYFKYAWEIWSKVLKESSSEEGFNMVVDVAIKLSDLIYQSGDPNSSYKILKSCEKDFGYTYEKNKKRSMEIKKMLIKYSEESQEFESYYEELVDFQVS